VTPPEQKYGLRRRTPLLELAPTEIFWEEIAPALQVALSSERLASLELARVAVRFRGACQILAHMSALDAKTSGSANQANFEAKAQLRQNWTEVVLYQCQMPKDSVAVPLPV
jgi:hypothetical protein